MSFVFVATLFVHPLSLRAGERVPGLDEQPLSARSGPRGSTLFRLVSPSDSGVVTENRYADPKMWGERYREFELGAIGTGVAIGDYDGDGRPDLFVVSKTESSRLFRNLGDWKFEDVTEKAGVADRGPAAAIWKQGVSFADVNNDGRLDLYVCRFGAPNLLYINQGNGTFKEEAGPRGLAVVDGSVMAAFCDYDRDGWLDVFVLTNLFDGEAHPNGQPDYLFHNNGDGTFTNVSARCGIAGETQGHSATWWDHDGDGWPDLYVANDFSGPDRLYRNNGDGTFSNVLDSAVPHTPFSSMGSDLGDINNDGWIDLLVADMAATTHEKDQRAMANMRAASNELPNDSTAAPQYLRNAVYLGTGTSRVLEAGFLTGLSATDWTWSVRFEDLDNDGRLDLHVTNGMHREAHNADLMSRMTLAANPQEKIQVERTSPVLAETHLAFRNLGELHFENVSAAWGLDQKGVGFGAAFGDLDGDGDLDLAYGNFQNGVMLLRNDNDSGHSVVFALKGTRSNRFGVGATVRIETLAGVQVRQLVLARGVLSNSEPVLHFGLGEDAVLKNVTVVWPSGETQSFSELPADRRYTITEIPVARPKRPGSPAAGQLGAPNAVSGMSASQFIEVSRAVGFSLLSREAVVDERAQQPLLPFRQNRRGPALAVADVNGDGRGDIVVGGTPADPLRIALRSLTDTFGPRETASLVSGSPLNDGPILVFDADGDGTMDMLVTKSGVALPNAAEEYQPKLFFSDGHGEFRPAPAEALPSLRLSAGAIVAADFDRDGRLDLFLGGRVVPGQYPISPHSALLLNRGGKFEDATEILSVSLREPGMVTAALASDVDGDGWIDLLIAVEWGSVRYFHNEAGKTFTERTEQAGFGAAGSGWWTGLAGADFNGDGRPDYVAGNAGLNTQYHPDAQHPALLFAGDFRGNGSIQLLEGYHEGEKVYPWRTRKELSALPSVAKRFTRTDVYARASLAEIVGESKLAAAQKFVATELRSGVFLSQPDGTFRFEPLPRLAQIAPMQGLVAGDFDGDGKADVYAVQNSYSPVPSVGRWDGGLSQLLRGDGAGHFSCASSTDSGLIVPGDAKALVVLDLNQDGWPDFALTRNNSSTLVFQNRGVPDRHELRVLLRGKAGNPTAIGARVRLELSGGSSQVSEVYGGGGYFSQSEAGCYFGWGNESRPQRVHVRWPSGRTTQHEIVTVATTLTIEEPSER